MRPERSPTSTMLVLIEGSVVRKLALRPKAGAVEVEEDPRHGEALR
ncbi:MAG TPA: hypothetical protein VK869_13700 [Rubrobacteraceae bacterium]|nr:hypothetical protein [Rubrobacteraceae bacterium]